MNESNAINTDKIEHIRSFLGCVIKAELNWEVEILTTIDTGVTHHSLLDELEFLFSYQNQYALSKNSKIKNWFIREDYQFQLMKYAKSNYRNVSNRKTISLIQLKIEGVATEMIILTPAKQETSNNLVGLAS